MDETSQLLQRPPPMVHSSGPGLSVFFGFGYSVKGDVFFSFFFWREGGGEGFRVRSLAASSVSTTSAWAKTA